jgi:hypothetical protein
MKQTVYLNDFRDAFQKMRPNNFSYEGLEILYDYLEEFYSDASTELELDVIALCCEYSESTYEEIAKDYNIGKDEDLNPEDIPQAVIDYLNDNTTILGELKDGQTLIYQQF